MRLGVAYSDVGHIDQYGYMKITDRSKDVIVIDEMPMTATGKIRKLDLREKYWNHLSN